MVRLNVFKKPLILMTALALVFCSSSLMAQKEKQVVDNEKEKPANGPFKVFGPRGNYVIAADKETKEFLEKAFGIGLLFPDPKFPGMLDFDITHFMTDDGQTLVLEYFPSGKLKVNNIAREKGKFIYRLPATRTTNIEPDITLGLNSEE